MASSAASSNRSLWRFGLISLLGVAGWAVGSSVGMGGDSPFDLVLCRQLASASAGLLRLLGWQAGVATASPQLLVLNRVPAVIVGGPCDGLVLYALLVGFVVAYPGPALRRLWFIPLGIGALWLVNVLRIVALALNHYYSPDSFDFNHHYAFSIVAYALLGALWLLWTRQGAPPATRSARSPLLQWLTPRVAFGLALLVSLALVGLYRKPLLLSANAHWLHTLAALPASVQRLPGLGTGLVPGGVTHLAPVVGVAYLAFYLVASLSILWLLLAGRSWQLALRGYGAMLLAYGLLLGLGLAGHLPMLVHGARNVLDFVASPLPVAGLLVMLWRPTATNQQPVAAKPLAGQAA